MPQRKKTCIHRDLKYYHMPSKSFYFPCPCCGTTFFYLRYSHHKQIICAKCGYTIEVTPEQIFLLSDGNTSFFAKSFHRFPAVKFSAIMDGFI